MGGDQRTRQNKRQQMERKHIFAVNSNPGLLELLRMLFQREEYNVTTTNYVPETFDQIAALKPDVLLVDLAWGERAGWDLLEDLRTGARTSGIPVIVLSTTPAYLERVRANPGRYDGDVFLAKPFDIEDVLGAVRKIIGTA